MENKNNTGYWNTGNSNTRNWNAGNRNTGDYNTGNSNTGNSNAGDWNAGYRNTGYRNAGDWNTGDWNTGCENTGDWNKTNMETGYFNTVQSEYINVFNKPCEREVWENANKPSFLYFNLTEWIYECDMTDKEKEENPTCKTTEGYLKSYEYKEAFQKSYDDLSKEERIEQTQQLKELPNFDKDVFFEISGIDIEADTQVELTLQEIADKFNVNIDKLRIKE